MDYEFSVQFDEVTASFSMGHEAIGQWFTEELGSHLSQIQSLLDKVIAIKSGQRHQLYIEGSSLKLEITKFGAQVSPLNSDTSLDELEEDDDSSLYDQESKAECGLEDFIEALSSWRDYVDNLSAKTR